MDTNNLWAALEKTQSQARRHAARCRSCCVPIIDPEGNPGFFSEACKSGAEILKAYTEAEKALFASEGL